MSRGAVIMTQDPYASYRPHTEVSLLDPFSGRMVGIDSGLVTIIEALWALDIETTGTCQGHPIDDAIICFYDPDPQTSNAEEEGWDEPADYDSPE